MTAKFLPGKHQAIQCLLKVYDILFQFTLSIGRGEPRGGILLQID